MVDTYLRKRKTTTNEVNKSTVYTGDDDYDGDGKSFTLLDYLRIFGGLLLINVVLSQYITGTLLWGQQTRWTNPRYAKFMLTGPHYVNLTEQELSKYNGENPDLPIYVAVNGSVYDVTSNPDTYGPGGPYHFFAGTDAARAYVTGCFQTDLTHDLRELDPTEAKEGVKGWQSFYEKSSKYWLVGRVNHPPLTGEPPAPCNGQKYPGAY